MGNTANASHPLPQLWQRISTRYLRHRLTQEIIEENPVSLPSQEEQLATALALKYRLGLHHLSIAKVIYYRIVENQSVCQQFQFNYQVLIYTEYTGDTLQKVIEQKGERLYHSTCQCTQIFSAADYLRDHYGFFCITPKMVFLGNRKQKNTKVWINSQVQLFEREIIANEEEMCNSICSLLRILKSHRFCKLLTDDQLENAHKIKKISELKTYILEAHEMKEEINRHKKSNSAAPYTQYKSQQLKSNICQRNDRNQKIEIYKKFVNVKATSMHQKSEQSKIHKGFESVPLKQRDLNDKNKIYSRVNHSKYISPDVYHPRPVQSHPLKVNFIYPQHENSKIGTKTTQNISQHQKQAILEISQPPNVHIKTEQQNIKYQQPTKKLLFQNDNQAMAMSLEVSNPRSFLSSPKQLDEPINNINFTAQQMQLPLQQAEEKTTPARLPTTSRSPKGLKEPQIKIIQEAPEITFNKNQIKISAQTDKYWKTKQKPVKINSNNTKFQIYKDAIKSYQQKLRLKLANSVGSSKPITTKPKNLLGVRKTTSSPKHNAEYKQARSIYNDSEQEHISQQNSKQILPVSMPHDKFDSQQSIPQRDNQQSYDKNVKKLEQIMNSKELVTKKMREKLQKIELEKQLEKQKLIIQSEMQDLLKQNAMRQQYRSIRQKIKQKKQTFAQLKAEATKILQDLDI